LDIVEKENRVVAGQNRATETAPRISTNSISVARRSRMVLLSVTTGSAGNNQARPKTGRTTCKGRNLCPQLLSDGRLGFTTAGNASLPPYVQIAWFSSASRCVRQEITRRIIELMVGYLGNSVNSLSANAINSIPAAKIRRNYQIC